MAVSTYLGKLGALDTVRWANSEPYEIVRDNTIRSLPSGGRVVFETLRSVRAWKVSIPLLSPDEVGRYERFFYRGDVKPPFIFISSRAAGHNILPPSDSLLVTGTFAGPGTFSSAPANLDGGGTSYSNVVVLSDNQTIGVAYDSKKSAYRKIPVIPGVPVSASAWVNSAGSGTMSIIFRDAAGAQISVSKASLSTGPANKRVAIENVMPPTGSVSCEMKFYNCRLIAKPAVTYTERSNEWGIGGGCYSAYFHSFSNPLDMYSVEEDGLHALGEVSFDVQELEV